MNGAISSTLTPLPAPMELFRELLLDKALHNGQLSPDALVIAEDLIGDLELEFPLIELIAQHEHIYAHLVPPDPTAFDALDSASSWIRANEDKLKLNI